MDKFIIEGGVPLKGEVTPAGNKNAALPLLAACLLTEEPIILRNIPHIRTCIVMREADRKPRRTGRGCGLRTIMAHHWRGTSDPRT